MKRDIRGLPIAELPKTRADCKKGPRPCPFVSCRHHLYLDINEGNGSLKLNFPDHEIEDIRDTCSLDVSDRGAASQEEIAEALNISEARVGQVEERAMRKVRAFFLRNALRYRDVLEWQR